MGEKRVLGPQVQGSGEDGVWVLRSGVVVKENPGVTDLEVSEEGLGRLA